MSLRIRGLDVEGPVRVHIEHSSGAALIVPTCEKQPIDGGVRLMTTGFDGTDSRSRSTSATTWFGSARAGASAILGGETSAVLTRVRT